MPWIAAAQKKQHPSGGGTRITQRRIHEVPFPYALPKGVGQVERAVIARLGRLLGIRRTAIGSGRDPISVSSADLLAQSLHDSGVDVTRVDWPVEAASWLRPARRLCASGTDGWVVLDHLAGAAQILRRLIEQDTWRADRTIVWSALRRPLLVEVVGRADLEGLRGVTPDGELWQIRDGLITDERIDDPQRQCRRTPMKRPHEASTDRPVHKPIRKQPCPTHT